MEQLKGNRPKDEPRIVSPPAWETARLQLLVKEKALTRARDALAAERRRMPWVAVEKTYEFDGPQGKVSLLDPRAVGSWSSIAPSSSLACSAGPSTPAVAARWAPTRSHTSPISTSAIPRSLMPRAHPRPISHV